MKKIILLHRWLGVLACIAILMFAGSGILHPVMSRFQPQPAQFKPPQIAMPQTALTLPAILQQNHIDTFATATAVAIGEQVAYRVQVTNIAARYFDVITGAEIAEGEYRHAQFLARYFLGDAQTPINHAQIISAFDDDYVFINRLLPVWRFDFERGDGIRIYVDTAGSRLATLSDSPKRLFQNYFRTLHNFNFLENHNTWRVTLMLVLLASTFTTAAVGLVMYVRLKRAAQRLQRLPVRRWHRRLALAISVVTFSFTISGTWHLIYSEIEKSQPEAPSQLAAGGAQFRSDELGDAAPTRAWTLLRVNDTPCYRVNGTANAGVFNAANMADEHAHHHAAVDDSTVKPAAPLIECLDTHSAQPILNAEPTLAENLARFYSGSSAPITAIVPIYKFDDEYGFLNKRLPVWKVQFADSDTHWYVENSSGALALRAEKAGAVDGWIFSIFHKARFIADPYKNLRDGFLMVVALGCIVVALLGMWLFIQQLRRGRAVGTAVTR
jgi:hypothetical protein